MTSVPTAAEPARPADPADEDAHLQRGLTLVFDAGVKLIEQLLADPNLPAAVKAEPYDRLARAVRRTAALKRHIAENAVKRAPSPAESRAQSRRQVIRDVEDLIETQAKRPERADSLRAELNERLDDPEFEHDLATRPLKDIIRDIKRDLGLDDDAFHKFPRRTPAEIRDLAARAAAPPRSRPPPEPAAAGFPYQPGQTRPNPLLARYRAAADG